MDRENINGQMEVFTKDNLSKELDKDMAFGSMWTEPFTKESSKMISKVGKERKDTELDKGSKDSLRKVKSTKEYCLTPIIIKFK